MTRSRTIIGAVLSALMGAALVLTGPVPAFAKGGDCGVHDCPKTDGGNYGSNDKYHWSATGSVRAQYAAGGQSCSVYANGVGMGAYCLSTGGGNAMSLRERFPNQTLDYCRYRPIPEGVPAPFNANPDKGRYLLQICLQNIDFDTFSGGANRSVKVDIVFVPPTVDITDDQSPINQFVWKSIERIEQLPVPFMVTRPNPTPVVGTPTFFTFRWLDPATQEVVRDKDGKYADKPNGGPFKEIVTAGGLTMKAEATKLTIDPRQQGMEPITCDPGTPYLEGKPANEQPAGACKIIFDRSSAQGRELSTVPMPWQISESFFSEVKVQWKVTYGRPGDMRPLGNGFTMRVSQGIKVQEIQAPNQPPIVIY